MSDVSALSVSVLALLACVRGDVWLEDAPDAGRWLSSPSQPDRSATQPWTYRSAGTAPDNAIEEEESQISDEFQEGVKFELYTRNNSDEPEYIDINNSSYTATLRHFGSERPTVIGVHGWLTDMVGMKSLWMAFLDAADINFIVVNWTGVDSILYPTSRGKVPGVARRLASLLGFLADRGGVDLGGVHLIGHSLGAHVCGIAGSLVQGRVGRITGFDPAGPLFEDDDPSQRLDPSDALFVDVIHTCGNVLGYSQPVGHVDFYPNKGKCSQPGCMLADITTGSCSHDRGYDFFRESLLNATSFLAWPCEGYGDSASESPDSGAAEAAEALVMGMDCPHAARGTYCLNTRASYPFGMGASLKQRNALRSTSPSVLTAPVAASIRRKFLRRGLRSNTNHFSKRREHRKDPV